MQLMKKSVDEYTKDISAGKAMSSKTELILRQTLNQAFADGLISDDELQAKLVQVSKMNDAIKNATNQKNIEKNITTEKIDGIRDDTLKNKRRRPDPLDEALDSLGPMLQGPTVTEPQSQAPAPRPQASGIASLQNRPEQLQKLEQVGLPLFDRG